MNPDASAPAAAPAQPACALALQWLGRQDYGATWDAMRAFTNARNVATPDQLWGVEHPPVFTLGQAGKPEHLLAPHAVPVVQTDRGGQVTFHGPGQSVIYLLLDIRRHRWMVRDTVDVDTCRSSAAAAALPPSWVASTVRSARNRVRVSSCPFMLS